MLVNGYNFPSLIIKFGKKENLIKLMDGSVYMKDYTFYKKLEDGMGDRFEGCEFSNQDVKISISSHTVETSGFLYYEPNENNKVPIFCAMWVDNYVAEFNNTNDNVGTVRFKIEIEKIIEDFECDYALVLSYGEFYDKIKKYSISNNLIFEEGLVKYYDYSDKTNPWLTDRINGFDRFYRKRVKFKHQNEIRFVIDTILKDTDNLTFNVGKFQFAILLPIEKVNSHTIILPCYKED